jgi:GNAT superfamily N-acetyltransferase
MQTGTPSGSADAAREGHGSDSIQLTRATREDAREVGQICYDAFGALYARFQLPPDFPSSDVTIGMAEMITSRPDWYGVVARAEGKIVGSNFVAYTDPVAGVGPITVLPGTQGRGVGRALMEHIVSHAIAHHGPQVRLVQDAINMVSLSLYTSLGFVVREPLVLLTFPPAETADATVRRVAADDLDACDALCRRIYKVSRRNELAGAIEHGSAMGMVPFLRERGSKIVGYVIPGFLGHGVAESDEDLLAILRTATRELPPHVARFLCPTRDSGLFRAALSVGARAVRGLHLMSMGPYEAPVGTWFPSIAY